VAASEPPRDVAELAGRFRLPAPAASQLAILLERLTGDPHAPTAVHDRRRALDDHLADSLSALVLPELRDGASIADIGSGAGLPGIPLAIALPRARVFLVESTGRKGGFIAETIAACGVRNAEVVVARAEEWAEGLGRCDVVTARALAPLPVVAEYAAPLLRQGGALVAWRGRRDPLDEAAGAGAARILGLSVQEPVAVTPYPGARHRHLHVLRKVAETPARFPRRPGAARKRPLGAGDATRGAPCDRAAR
jgi:16S rRNA (guanine527-N7)-methyltransferase